MSLVGLGLVSNLQQHPKEFHTWLFLRTGIHTNTLLLSKNQEGVTITVVANVDLLTGGFLESAGH